MRQRVSMLVDAARFFLFHPKDCVEAAGELDPPDDAFLNALVVGLHLGADGARALEVTDALDDTDRADVDGAPFVFPLRVKRGKLFATDRIPHVDEFDWDTEPHVALDKGAYRASWYLLKPEAIERRNVNWLLHVERVETLANIPTWFEFPSEDQEARGAVQRPKAERRVRHAKFGDGTVVDEVEGKLVIAFDDGQRRTLLARFVSEI